MRIEEEEHRQKIYLRFTIYGIYDKVSFTKNIIYNCKESDIKKLFEKTKEYDYMRIESNVVNHTSVPIDVNDFNSKTTEIEYVPHILETFTEHKYYKMATLRELHGINENYDNECKRKLKERFSSAKKLENK